MFYCGVEQLVARLAHNQDSRGFESRPRYKLILESMKKIFTTILLAIVAIAGIAWACSYSVSGLAWFPGAFVAVCCGIGIMDIHGVGQEEEKEQRQ